MGSSRAGRAHGACCSGPGGLLSDPDAVAAAGVGVAGIPPNVGTCGLFLQAKKKEEEVGRACVCQQLRGDWHCTYSYDPSVRSGCSVSEVKIKIKQSVCSPQARKRTETRAYRHVRLDGAIEHHRRAALLRNFRVLAMKMVLLFFPTYHRRGA